MGSRKTGKQPHWFTYITFIFRCSKPGAASCSKHESQPSEAEVPNPSPESVTPLNEKVDLSEA